MAAAFQALGSAVTLLIRGDGLLPKLEEFAGTAVAAGLRETGVDVRFGAETTAVHRDDTGVRIEVVAAGEKSVVRADEILVAVGRKPALAGLGLETAGLDPDKPLTVDDGLRVEGVDWLYAVGDVNGRVLLTHQGKYQARICGDVIVARSRGEQAAPAAWSKFAATADHRAVPSVVFTDPEVGSVGLTEAQARDAGLPVRAVEYDLGWVAGASLFADDYAGRAKMVVDTDRNVVLGATFVGAGIAELLHSATVAIVGEVPLDRLWHAVPSYPTISEVWLRFLETYGL
jgi:dihydrolipoamide dehydrogenase